MSLVLGVLAATGASPATSFVAGDANSAALAFGQGDLLAALFVAGWLAIVSIVGWVAVACTGSTRMAGVLSALVVIAGPLGFLLALQSGQMPRAASALGEAVRSASSGRSPNSGTIHLSRADEHAFERVAEERGKVRSIAVVSAESHAEGWWAVESVTLHEVTASSTFDSAWTLLVFGPGNDLLGAWKR